MKSTLLVFALIISTTALGHPGSGIAVDEQGRIVFVDTGAGVWRLERNGTLNKLPGPAYHWLALDRTGQLSRVELPSFAAGGARTVNVDGVLLASDFPITVGSKGELYYPRIADGGLQILRLDVNGSTSSFAKVGTNAQGNPLRWINGSVIAPDGSFYYSEDHGVWKIAPDKKIVALYTDIPKLDCSSVPGVGSKSGPHFRGIDIDANGNLFVAVTACRAVIKIAPDKTISAVIQAEGAWSPTGVATFGSDVYVLEYLHTEGENRQAWIPRIRQFAADGAERIVAAVKRR